MQEDNRLEPCAPASAKRPATATVTLLWLAIGTGISLLVSLVFGELAGPLLSKDQAIDTLAAVLLASSWVGSILLPAFVVAYALVSAFRRRSRSQALRVILFAYLSILLSFTGIYYSMSVVGDLREADDAFIYYQHAATRLAEGRYRQVPRRVADSRAFHGMDRSPWKGLEEEARPFYMHRDAEIPVEFLLEAARQYGDYGDFSSAQHRYFAPKFDPQARLPLLADCLHLSVVTMATLGYGDISPQRWYSKLATDLQVLAGQVLFVVALGMLFGQWWS